MTGEQDEMHCDFESGRVGAGMVMMIDEFIIRIYVDFIKTNTSIGKEGNQSMQIHKVKSLRR